MKHSITSLALVASASCLLAPGVSRATVLVDQSNTPGPSFYNPLGPTFVPDQNTAEMAQVFTVGITGQLTGVSADLLLFSPGVFTLSVFPTIAGVPDTTGLPLASLTQVMGTGEAFYGFDLTAANLIVTSGDVLAYHLSGDFSRWVSSDGDSYAGGTAFWRFPGATDGSPTDWAALSYDAYFQTFVDDAIPTPGTLALLALGGLPLTRRRR